MLSTRAAARAVTTLAVFCFVLAVVVACGGDEPDSICQEELVELDVSVEDAAKPRISWTPRCEVVRIAVCPNEVLPPGSDEGCWTVEGQNSLVNSIRSGVTYGETPDGAVRVSSGTPRLVDGIEYAVMVYYRYRDPDLGTLGSGYATFRR